MAAAVDAGYLAASYSIPESTIQSLLSEPTVDLVQSLLVQIEARARDFEDLQSEKLKADVELDNAVQSGEQRARALKAAAEKAQKEADELRQRIAQEETARQQLETQLHHLQTTTASSSAQVQTLESRIKTLESQNRDALATYETKATAYDRLAKELSEQHQKFVDVRKSLSALEEKNQTLQSAANNARFRETNLQQEIELLRKNNDWHEAELKTRSNDNTKFRKDKNAQVAELQRANADASETIDSLRRTETLLRKHMEELKAKAEEDRTRIQQLEDDAANNEANFRSELDNAKRLTALRQKTADMAKRRLEELTTDYNNLQESAAEEVGQLQADVELERNKAAEAEAQVANLESIVENLEREAAQLKSAPAPGTPRRPTNGAYNPPGHAGSPAVFSPGGSQLTSVMGNTKILAENRALGEQLRNARDENEKKTALMQTMIDELEQLEPAIEELRRTNETLTAQISDMSNDLEDAVAEKDDARKDERKVRGDLEGAHRECAQLRQHVQDLTVQLRSLMWRQQAAEQGLDSLTAEQQQFIVSSENNELPDGQAYGDTATDALISKHLVLYKNVVDVQSQNASLLRTIREVAQQHEGAEARNNQVQQEKDQQELSRLRIRIVEYDDQIKSLNIRAHSYKKERDMYRQVATSRGIVPQESDAASAFAQSFNSQAPMTPMRGTGGSQYVEQTPLQLPGVDKLVKDLQTQVDVLKEESATDRATLKTQVDNLTKDNHQLQSERLRLENQLRREKDRFHQHELSVKVLQTEKDTLQERYHSIQATLARQDDKVIKAEQEAVDAVARLEGTQNELTNLKASQSMWKTIEARLAERNQELTIERDRLSKLLTDVQNLRNEQELTNAETRRRLQDRVDALERDLQIAERKLDDEVTEHKKIVMQRDYERTEAQRRIEDLMKAKNEADVRCASADAARQQLEQRVSELQSQLQLAEERGQSLRPIPTPRVNGTAHEEEDVPNHEEELVAEVAELQRQLNRKQEDLDDTKASIKDLEINSQEAEDALQKAVETHEFLEGELDRVRQEKDSAITKLLARVEEISSELTTTSSELSELRGRHEQETLRLTQEKESLEAEVANLKNDVSDYKAEAERQMEYVKSQAEIATRARQDYEQELSKHGATMNSLRTLRDEHNSFKSEIARFKVQAETARAALEQNEERWKTTKDRYETQLVEVQRTLDDLKQHNRTLLQQFDNYKAQISDLKSNRSAMASGDAASIGTSSSTLDEINAFLRQEMDILQVQDKMKEAEVKRLESRLSQAESQLDQAREKLNAERSRNQNSQGGSSLQVLQNQVEQLNVFRESNSTLRNETTRLEAKFAEKSQEVQHLQNELEPLRARVTELEGELELTAGYLDQEKENRELLQKRFDKFKNNSEKIDPKELEDLKKSIEDVQTERDQLAEQVASLKEEIASLQQKAQSDGSIQASAIAEAVKDAKRQQHERFQSQHREKMAAKKDVIDALTKERDEAQTQLATVQQESEDARKKLTSVQALADQSMEQVAALQLDVEQVRSQLVNAQQELESANAARASAGTQATTDVNMAEEGQIDERPPQGSSEQIAHLQSSLEKATAQMKAAQSQAHRADNDAAALQVQVSLMNGRVTDLQEQDKQKTDRIVELQGELDQVKAKLQQSQSAVPTMAPSADSAVSAELETLKQQLSEAQKALKDAQASAVLAAAAGDAPSTGTKPNSQPDDALSATTKAELDEREAKLKETEAALEQRETKVTKREGQTAKVLETARERVEKARAQKDEEIATLTNETNRETERLKGQIAALQAEIKRLKEEQQAAGASRTTNSTNNTVTSDSDNTVRVVYKDLLDEVNMSPALLNTPIDTESLPRPTATGTQMLRWIRDNRNANQVIVQQIRKRVDPKDADIAKFKAEIEQLKAQKPSEATVKSENVPQHNSSRDVEAALVKAASEHAEVLKKAVDAKEKQMNIRARAKEGLLNNVQKQWNVINSIAKATPTKEVGQAVKEAVEEAKKPQSQPTASAQQPSQAQTAQHPTTSVAGQPLPAAAPNQLHQQQPLPTSSIVAQPNGTNVPVPAQAPQLAPVQQPSQQIPTAQASHLDQNNPFIQAQLGRGITPPGFTGQQQHQQGGRGQGNSMGTGLRALQTLGAGQNQSGIPRGGSGIPMPGGRGRGQHNPTQPGQQHTNQNQPPNINTALNASQIGRGGRGGRGGGRGANQGSPRQSLNPGAQQFQPGGPGAGRGQGQKRGAEDDGEAAGRGGKRARGGRGGVGGGAAE